MVQTILFNAVDVPSNLAMLVPDNGLASLAACLREAGHSVEVCDIGTVSTVKDYLSAEDRQVLRRFRADATQGRLTSSSIVEILDFELRVEVGLDRAYTRACEDIDRRIGWNRVSLLGLKLWAGCGVGPALAMASQLVRRAPGLRVFAGGPLATLRAEALLRAYPVLTAVCVGHGDETVVGLAEHCAGRRAMAQVPNLVFRDGTALRHTESRAPRLQELPPAVYDPEAYPAMAGAEKLPILCVEDSRGCSLNCPFCAHPTFSGSVWQRVEPERIAARMDHYFRQTGTRAFRLSGSYTPSFVYRALGERLTERGAPYLYAGFSNIGGFDVADLPKLKQSGLATLFFGLESGSETLLRSTLRKSQRADGASRVLGACMDADIFPCASVIFPAPGETETTAGTTLDLLRSVFRGRTNGSILVIPPLLEPGARWWAEPERFGFEGDREEVLAALCTRRVRYLMPMNHFQPLPYRLDGRSFRDVCSRSEELVRTLRAEGCIVNMDHDAALFARVAGITPAVLQGMEHEAFRLADADRITDLIRAMRRPVPANAAAGGTSDVSVGINPG
jgi:hypothetical protein